MRPRFRGAGKGSLQRMSANKLNSFFWPDLHFTDSETLHFQLRTANGEAP